MARKIQVSAIRSYRSPNYPIKEDVVRNPSILRAMPKRWDARPIVGAVLTFSIVSGLCAFSSGCDNADKKLDTIPIFRHGKGFGAYGCVVVAPPAFFSEEEAQQIIREEALTMGVDFSETKTIVGSFPKTSYYGTFDNGKNSGSGSRIGTLQFDGYDKELGIGFEFVSEKDFNDWVTNEDALSTAKKLDFCGTAQRLSDSTNGVAVFYDPFIESFTYNDDYYALSEEEKSATIENFYAEQKKLQEENLRLQVRDFLSWLQGQGII